MVLFDFRVRAAQGGSKGSPVPRKLVDNLILGVCHEMRKDALVKSHRIMLRLGDTGDASAVTTVRKVLASSVSIGTPLDIHTIDIKLQYYWIVKVGRRSICCGTA